MELHFGEHTKEKLDVINYYYKTWFKIVKNQNAYIIDAFAGTGYDIIGEKRELGSALLAIDTLKNNSLNNLKMILINNNESEIITLRTNILTFLSDNNLKAKIDDDIKLITADWATVIDDVLKITRDGISLYLLDPYAVKPLSWNDVYIIIQKALSVSGYKESGIEVLINWAWHTVRRLLGKYYKSKLDPTKDFSSEISNLDNFFGPINWRAITERYPPTIFKKKDNQSINNLQSDLILAYVKPFFNFFKYVKIHPVSSRIKTIQKDVKKKGKIKYFLIFASNYIDALKIIGTKMNEYVNKQYFLPKTQTDIMSFIKNKDKKPILSLKKITINEKLNNLESNLKIRLTEDQKSIIKKFYTRRTQNYGYYDFTFKKELSISEEDLQFFIERGIIGIREKKFRNSDQYGRYFYLIHPTLVNRNDYLYFNDEIYLFRNGDFEKIN